MSAAIRTYETGVWWVWSFLAIAAMGAGGLGAAGAVGFIGLMLLPLMALRAFDAIKRSPLLPGLITLALIWSALTLAWSPYDKPDQAIKLTILTPFYLMVVFAALQLDRARAAQLSVWIAGFTVVLAGFFLFEAVTNAPLTSWYKINVEGETDPVQTAALVDRLLARGVTGMVMVAGPAALILGLSPSWLKRAGAGLILLACLVGGIAFGVEANLLSLILGLGFAGFAFVRPRIALAVLCLVAALAILGAPLYIGLLVALTPDSLAESLPLTWHMRLEIWRYTLEQIAASPLIGQGLDASRVLGGEAELRGIVFDRLPLHPHNIGLNIWLETGFVGALLFAATLLAAARAALRLRIDAAQAAGLAHAGAAFLGTVLVGSGIWQEWLHGCLALGCAMALMIRR